MKNLIPGQKLTIIEISEWMAHTQKHEIEIISVLDTPEERRSYVNGPIHAYRYGTMKPRGKRKECHLDIRTEALVFDGWSCLVKTDSEVLNGSFSGNACFNLGGMTADELRKFIECDNLNELTDDIKGKILHVADGANVTDDGELLWPKIDIAHAVVNRIKEKATAGHISDETFSQ